MNPYKHKHWIFLASNHEADEKGGVREGTEVTVNDAEDEEAALTEVKKMLVRENYWLKKVYECSQCAYTASLASSQAQIAKHLKDHES